MLPQTNRYGDLLREFYEGIKNDNLSSLRMDEIVRVFNELSQRENTYKSWLGEKGAARFENVFGKSGYFELTPIEAVFMYNSNTVSIPNDTETLLTTWEYTFNRSKIFRVESDGKIRIHSPNRLVVAFCLSIFTTSSSGRRAITVKAFNALDTQIGGMTLFSTKSSAVVDAMPGISWIPVEEDTDYYKPYAYQNSGGNLDLEYIELALLAMQ